MRRFTALVAVLLMGALPAAAHPTGSHGHIEGSVTGEDTGLGVGGVCVEAFSYDDNWGSAETADDGTYSMDVPPGTYRVRFTDCVFPARYVGEYYDNAATFDDAASFPVGLGETVGGIDAALSPGGHITGTITDQGSGEPITGVCVSAFDSNYEWVGSGISGEQGNYAIGGLSSADLRVSFGEHCYYVPFIRPVPVSAAGGAPGSVPPPPPDVVANDSYISEWWDDKPDFEAADPVEVTQGLETSGIDAALELGGSIAGVITDEEGEELEGVCVSAYDATSGDHRGYGFQGEGPQGYEIDGLRTGAYKVEFQDCWEGNYRGEWYDDKRSFGAADAVAVTAGDLTPGVDAVLARRARADIALDRMTVEPVPLSTDVVTAGSTGTQRTVTVYARNRGDAEADGVLVMLYAQGRTDGRWTYIGDRWLGSVAAGDTEQAAFRWNATGAFGDTRLYAEVCSYDDADYDNNTGEADAYVIAGGTGFGFSPVRGGDDYPQGCYYWEAVA